MIEKIILYSRSGRFAAIGIAIIALFFLVMVAIYDGPVQLLRVAPLPLLVVFFCAWFWAWPRLILQANKVTIINQLRKITLTWDEIEEASVNFGLYLECKTGRNKRSLHVAGIPSKARQEKSQRKDAAELPLKIDEDKEAIWLSMDPQEAAGMIEAELHTRRSSNTSRYWAKTALTKNPESPNDTFNTQWNWPMVAIMVTLIASSANLLFV